MRTCYECNEAAEPSDFKLDRHDIMGISSICTQNVLLRQAVLRKPLHLPQASSGEPGRYADSFCKMLALLRLCDELDIETAPAIVAEGVSVVPLLSWYNSGFDAANPLPGKLRYDKFCRCVNATA